jgi:hypothetical protein
MEGETRVAEVAYFHRQLAAQSHITPTAEES